jgi:hypothetical protein
MKRQPECFDLFSSDAPPCPYATEEKCPLAHEAARGIGHLSLITLGTCAECPGHDEQYLFGGPHAGGRPHSPVG